MYNYNYGNYGMNQYNPYANQNTLQEMKQMRDKLDSQIQQAQQPQQMMPNQLAQPQIPQINQSFQLAPTTNSNSELEARYAENIDEVKNTFVMKTGIFVTKDLSTIWQKDVSGNIRIFKTEEILQRDEKDIQIQQLQDELNSMKALMSQAIQQTQQPINDVDDTPVEKPKTTTRGRR